ncbi:hypothetical protein PQJ75_10580 [Rhodoplanes sp. TEM]|uniref:Uncharacterized protein n=1 Tax=Rhodoplanes tepidamans TaxID=200616 RepID=A0ABT5JC03_RHOTP|nr:MULTISPECIES: hypothetical protein [Rhodoplanes]MDC7787209.1 hypothetical protein [Rhodoplanes tepidamans]MDC7984175.1 hypothetical protein [Rhodoplanes sp. TEM]MDQ0356024.1 hypothetical protein [Rhodoplanes tepidamans]
MNADRTPGLVAGLLVFVGSIGGLFLVARLTHFAFLVAKHPEDLPAVDWSQIGLAAAALLIVAAIAAAAWQLFAHRHGPHHHRPHGHGPLGHYSGRAA